MAEVEPEPEFVVDVDRIDLVNTTLCDAFKQERGLFSGGFKQFLPQWNLPSEVEFDPPAIKVQDPLRASLYLWTCAFFERMNQSRYIITNAARVWNDPNKRWFFHPVQVATHSLEQISDITLGEFQFNLTGLREEPPEKRYLDNALLLVNEYHGDPRKLIEERTVEEARKNIMQFKGIGSGIANLYILYLLEREITSPTDPENVLLKVDIHKARLLLNTQAVKTKSQRVRRGMLTPALEKAYLESSRRQGLDPRDLDAALWITGSEGCARRDYSFCLYHCVLCDSLCTSLIGYDENTSDFLVFDDSQGTRRVDTRKNVGQLSLF
ncbi:MAG: hypothetical protein WC796_04485 [Candidatus Pacearchaeota archaeon]|jgi:hypothetical protein